ncbi:hypothetical protein [Urechidicola croceus]|uniref:Baseplate protein J-like domain-containing protein n=1 Tax=Urechidicola croceus TaxID=1850246 RepID=A0A1D8P804_9FLAO|nr:hypothetical protein [Urechidicola croceus]AOW20705.1 hypothetical protein LPB138_08460 [Urechidicola croceus]
MNKGTSRDLRSNKALDANYISIDERSILDMVRYTMDFSKSINFYNHGETRVHNWTPFFLNNPAFIIASITATDIKKFRIKNDKIIYESYNITNEKKAVLAINNILEMVHFSTNWLDLFQKAAYDGSLVNEIENLLKSLTRKIEVIKKWIQDLVKQEKHESELETLVLSYQSLQKKLSISKIDNTLESNNSDTPKIEYISETFEHIYRKILFIKEKATNEFEKEILTKNNHAPHIGLLLTFFKLFKYLQSDINLLTKKHLDYYYKNLLQQKRKSTNSYEAQLSIKLDQEIDKVVLKKGDKFNFILEDDIEHEFSLIEETEINTAEISDIRTLFKSDYQPYSSKFDEDDFMINILYESNLNEHIHNNQEKNKTKKEKFFSVFGDKTSRSDESLTNHCDVGLVVSSPSLILEKGIQKVELIFNMERVFEEGADGMFDKKSIEMFNRLVQQQSRNKKTFQKEDFERKKKGVISKFLRDAFVIFITTSDGWKQLDSFSISLDDSKTCLDIGFHLKNDNERLVIYNSEIHEGNYKVKWPCIKIILNNETQYHAYKFLENCVLKNIQIKTSVSEVETLKLTNSLGNLDNSIPFSPFGPTPMVGSFLRIQNPLIFQKNLSNLKITLNWIGLPQSKYGFREYYKSYPFDIDNDSFRANITQKRNNFNDKGQIINLFDVDNRDLLIDKKEEKIFLEKSNFNNRIEIENDQVVENEDSLFIVLTSPEEMAFGHHVFNELYAEAAIKKSRFRRKLVEIPKQPYTPIIEKLTLQYSNASKEIMLRKQDENSSDIKLIHLYPFGHVQVFPGPIKASSFFLPQIKYKGNLLLGLKNIKPNDIVSLGFELIPAVYIHSSIQTPKVKWYYLLNNEWEPIGNLLLDDGTNNLIKSGIIKIRIPDVIQFDNTRLPNNKFWIRACYNGQEEINSKIKKIYTQAISVRSTNDKKEFVEFSTESKPKKITILNKKGINSIRGPFDYKINESFETESSFYSRASEQLRHKNKIVTCWDAERIILDKFSQVDKVRVYSRNNYPNEITKGSTLQVVLIPKYIKENRNTDVKNNISYPIFDEVKKYLSKFVSPFVSISVSNPVYEQLKVKCKVKFDNFQKSGQLIKLLNDELVDFLTPGSENTIINKGFDDSISKTVILNFIESRPYVNYVTGFSVLQLIEIQERYKIIDTALIDKIEELRTISAYAILTSVPKHNISAIDDELSLEPKPSGVQDLSVESDFVIIEGKDVDFF